MVCDKVSNREVAEVPENTVGEKVVSVEAISKSFGDVRAVDEVSFNINRGEIYGFLGPNGAGKTTTISIISTYLEPDSGDAIVGGWSVVEQPFEVKKLIGICPQEVALYEELSAEQNLHFFGRVHGLGRDVTNRKVDELLDFAGLTEKRKVKTGSYSGGMKRRLNIACSLLNDPRFLMLDEPTIGVDVQARARVYEMIETLKEKGTTILYTTHYMEEAQDLCDRVGIIDDGSIIAEGTIQELLGLIERDEVIEFALSAPIGDMGEFGRIPGVKKIEHLDDGVKVVTSDATAVLDKISSMVRERGRDIKRMTVSTPDLEDVFLHLTGRNLRE